MACGFRQRSRRFPSIQDNSARRIDQLWLGAALGVFFEMLQGGADVVAVFLVEVEPTQRFQRSVAGPVEPRHTPLERRRAVATTRLNRDVRPTRSAAARTRLSHRHARVTRSDPRQERARPSGTDRSNMSRAACRVNLRFRSTRPRLTSRSGCGRNAIRFGDR